MPAATTWFGLVTAISIRAAAGAAVPLTYSGYLIDNECYDRVLAGGSAPDGSDIVADPAPHKAVCMLLDGTGGTAPCEPNGYYLAMDCGGGNYHKKFLLDANSHANAKAYLESLQGTDNDLLVTAHGINNHGTLENATFTACSGMGCDGVCTPDNANDPCEGVMDDVCADNTVTYSGYIIDWYCYGQILAGQNTPDGSDVVASPADHSLGCLIGPTECHESGYYVAEMAGDGTYHPKYDLRHASSNDTVLAFLQDLASTTGNSETSIAVTVTGKNMDGVLHDVSITRCTNTDSSDDADNDRGCDSVCTGACDLTALTPPGPRGRPVTYSGYLIDNECYDRVLAGGSAPDGSDIVADPSPHKAVCMLLDGTGETAPCEPNGYYLAMDCGGGNYHKKFLLDANSHANAKEYLESLQSDDNDLKVTAHGYNHDGTLINATFTACTGTNCDGVCTPDNAMDPLACEGVMDDVCADNTVTYSGYIIDWYCYGQILAGEDTPDGSDVIASPADHTLGCLVTPTDCHESGYYVAQRVEVDGAVTYHPKYDLRHSSSSSTVLAFLQDLATTAGGSETSIAVTVTGRNVNGALHHVSITRCSNTDSSDDADNDRGCDSVCTGACDLMGLTATSTTASTTADGGSGTDDASFGRISSLPGSLAMLFALMMIAK